MKRGVVRVLGRSSAVAVSKVPSRGGSSEPAEPAVRMLVPAVDRAMRILSLLESQPQQSFTVSDIARALRIPKSTTFNICGALADGQLVRRTHDGFQLGRRLVQLGSAYVSSVNLVREFYDACRSASPSLHAIIQLAVLDDDFNAVYLAHQDCNSGLQLGLGGSIGRRVPANCAACGKALLAALPPEELNHRLDEVKQLPKLTRKSIITRAKLVKELTVTRERGFAMDEEETLLGLSCVASAIATSHGERGFVAVSISASVETLTDERKTQIASTLRALVESLRFRV
jgi:IclR family transcriptional regulator, blcABC operon repressor